MPRTFTRSADVVGSIRHDRDTPTPPYVFRAVRPVPCFGAEPRDLLVVDPDEEDPLFLWVSPPERPRQRERLTVDYPSLGAALRAGDLESLTRPAERTRVIETVLEIADAVARDSKRLARAPGIVLGTAAGLASLAARTAKTASNMREITRGKLRLVR